MGPSGEAAHGGVGFADLHALASDGERDVAVKTVGIPQQVSAAGVLEAVPMADGWLAALPESPDDIEAWGDAIASDPGFAALLYRTQMTADMGGQLFVRTVEVPESLPRTAKLAVVDASAFFALPFDEAIRAFLSRRLLSPAAYRRLSAEARARAFSVSLMTSREMVAKVREELARTLQDGGSYGSFRAAVQAGEIDLGVTPAAPSYLENVFRTNTASAYGAGRLRQILDPAVRAARPFVEYRTARDSRVRPSHAALEGVVFRQDDPSWRRYAPPLGYQCRCTVVTRRADAVDLRRVVDAATLTVEPTAGFGNPRL